MKTTLSTVFGYLYSAAQPMEPRGTLGRAVCLVRRCWATLQRRMKPAVFLLRREAPLGAVPRAYARDLLIRLKLRRWPARGLFSLVWVPPEAVAYVQTGPPSAPFTKRGRLPDEAMGLRLGGDWDRAVTPITETGVYTGLYQRFVEGRPWRETCLHPEQFEREHPALSKKYRKLNERKFERKTTALDTLYHMLAEEGYNTARGGRLPATDEPAVNVTRDGALVRNTGGLHRLILCRLLNLPAVPVRVHVVHADWNGKLPSVPAPERRAPQKR